MRRALAEHRVFWQEFRRNFRHTGAVLPSGRWLAAALARYARTLPGPKRVLEVGPGTGVVSRAILRRLSPGDRFDLVELNDRFVEILRTRQADDRHFRRHGVSVDIWHARIEDFQAAEPYDLIVSGLPLNNFDTATIRSIFAAFRRLSKPGGIVSFFEYVGVRPTRAIVGRGAERTRFRDIHRLLAATLRRHEIRRDWIWPNVPPAWVHHLRFDSRTTGRTRTAGAGLET